MAKNLQTSKAPCDGAREGVGKKDAQKVLCQKGQGCAQKGGGDRDVCHGRKPNASGKMAQKDAKGAMQQRKLSLFQSAGGAKVEKADQKSAVWSGQDMESALKMRKDGDAERADGEVSAHRTEGALPSQKESAKGNGKGLQGDRDSTERQGNLGADGADSTAKCAVGEAFGTIHDGAQRSV